MVRRHKSAEFALPLTSSDGTTLASPFEVPEEKLEGKLVPQADEPERILQLVERINKGLPIDAEGLGIDPRQVDYYTQAAQILGLVSTKNRLRAAGRALLTLDDRARRARLALAFENSKCGRAWTRWYRAPSLSAVRRKSAMNFILDAVDLNGETIGRRASTLKKWMRAWMPFHPAVNPEIGIPMGNRKAEALGHIAVLDSGQSRRIVQALGPGTAVLRCATAYLSVGGYELLVEPLRGAELCLLVGSESTFKSVEQILERFRQSIAAGPPTRVNERDIGLVHNFYKAGGDIEQVRQECSRIPTSMYLIDRAEALRRDVTRANALSIGVRSCKSGPKPGIFALLRVGAGLRCIFWPADGSPAEESPAPLSHEALLQYVKAIPETALAAEPTTFKSNLGVLIEHWAEKQKLESDAVTVICAEAIVSRNLDGCRSSWVMLPPGAWEAPQEWPAGA